MVTHAGEPRGPLRGFSPTPHMWWDRGESLKRPVRPAGRGRADGGGPSMAGEDHDLIDRIARMLRDAGVECEILNLVPTDEAVLRRDRVVIVLALTLLAALAWNYLLWLSVDMDMGGMDMTGLRTIPSGMGLMVPAHMPWRAVEFASVFAMWTVMMVGMMTPSAAPMFLIYAGMGRQSDAQGAALSATVWFAAGYFLVWVAFSLIATLVHGRSSAPVCSTPRWHSRAMSPEGSCSWRRASISGPDFMRYAFLNANCGWGLCSPRLLF